MTTAAETPKETKAVQGYWQIDRQGGVVNHYPHEGASGENITVRFGHKDGTPEIQLEGAAAAEVRMVVDGRADRADIGTLLEELAAADRAAEGDSNDKEIQAYQDALETATRALGVNWQPGAFS